MPVDSECTRIWGGGGGKISERRSEPEVTKIKESESLEAREGEQD